MAMTMLFCTACAPDLKGVEIINISFSDTGYAKSADWDHAQGLATDGKYFYFAGHNDKTNENADIYVIDSDMKDVRVLKKAGPLHSAVMFFDLERETLFASSGGNGRKPFVFEIDVNDGTKLNEWYFDGVGENGGAGIAKYDTDKIILFTSSDDGAKISFAIVALRDGGEFTIEKEYYFSSTDLGVPQGLIYRDGYIYYLADAGITVNANPHYIYKLALTDEISIIAAYKFKLNAETEGLCYHDGKTYIGTAKEKIFVTADI